MPSFKVAIYDPPTDGFPYIVLVAQGDEFEMVAVKTRREARDLSEAKRQSLARAKLTVSQKIQGTFGPKG